MKHRDLLCHLFWSLVVCSSSFEIARATDETIYNSVLPRGGADISHIPMGGQAHRSTNLQINITNKCHPDNLRFVVNPVSLDGTIIATITGQVRRSGDSDAYEDFSAEISYSGVAVQGGLQNSSELLKPKILSISPTFDQSPEVVGHGNIVSLRLPGATTVYENGSIKGPKLRNLKVRFRQDMPNLECSEAIQQEQNAYRQCIEAACANPSCRNQYCTSSWGPFSTWRWVQHSQYSEWVNNYFICSGNFSSCPALVVNYDKWLNCVGDVGHDGPLISTGGITPSSDRSHVEINADFAGEPGYCGGYWSPLMVFFDDKRPKFTGKSFFKLSSEQKPTQPIFWPEPNAPGSFVAIDSKGDGNLTLFGNQEAGIANGFEALKHFDSNLDLVLDKRDKEFSKLLLWSDKNGDGVAQGSEVIPLVSKIESISLKYDSTLSNGFGLRAQAKERSYFIFSEGRKRKKGAIVDIWLAPYSGDK